MHQPQKAGLLHQDVCIHPALTEVNRNLLCRQSFFVSRFLRRFLEAKRLDLRPLQSNVYANGLTVECRQ